MLGRCVFLAAALLTGECLQAAAVTIPLNCIAGTLATYEALGSIGCLVGPIIVKDFAFSVLTSGGGAVPLSNAGIIVTPSGPGPVYGLDFASPGFSVIGAGFVKYLVAFTWDPSDDIQSLDDVMDPPLATGAGLSRVTTVGCLNAPFTCAVCQTSAVTLNVFNTASSQQLTDSVSFTPVAILGIRQTIDLEALGGSASFDSIRTDITIPEPPTWISVVTFLALLSARLRLEAGGVRFQHFS